MLRLAALAAATIFFVLFNLDDRKIDNDYTWDDVPNPPRAEESYALLLEAFSSEGKGSAQLDLPDDMEAVFKDPLSHKAEIEKWWLETTEARQALAKLDSYEAIGDLTDGQLELVWFSEVRNLFRVIFAYTTLKLAEGHFEEGIPYFRQCHSTTRKILPCSRYLINKLIWLANAYVNIKGAYALINHPNCKQKTLETIRNDFNPITETELAIKRTFITEYLFAKDGFLNQVKGDNYLNHVFLRLSTTKQEKLFHNPWERTVSKIFFFMTFKPNRALNDIKTVFDFVIIASERHPIDFEKLKSFERMNGNKLKMNNVGKWLLSGGSPSRMSEHLKRIIDIKIFSDLLAFYLDNKIDGKSDLKDFYTGIVYQLDKEYGARSAGPDGQFNTEDDITLDVVSGK
ncbi:MAG: hypothetical protein EHM45_20185 [Desulfobacteraceae bacterium]|nr:MAG: hypothetical protein EHM45_20185 [Desulfobacteraceae bacterium]